MCVDVCVAGGGTLVVHEVQRKLSGTSSVYTCNQNHFNLQINNLSINAQPRRHLLPELKPVLGSSPHMDTEGNEEAEGGDEEGEELEDGEEGEVSMGVGPLE